MDKDGRGNAVSAFTTIARVGPTQQIREQLLAAIEGGDYPPGSALPSERALCESFGVSRVSVREAIAGLEAMGLIVVKHGRGAFVREGAGEEYAAPFAKYLQLHRDELLELLRVRGALDELAAEEAALHGTKNGVARLVEANERFRTAAEGELGAGRLALLDVAFHVSIAEAVGGSLLPSLLRELNGILDDSRRMTLAREGQLPRSAAEHQAIVDAILGRDAAEARRAANQHLAGIRTWVSEYGRPRSRPAS
ncbi:MAG: FadR/GntR family transcriptional regulator [Mycobacteriales bacterium]|jgi:GntR family transcriptional repressor for pyruvate dehydrogenase complex